MLGDIAAGGNRKRRGNGKGEDKIRGDSCHGASLIDVCGHVPAHLEAAASRKRHEEARKEQKGEGMQGGRRVPSKGARGKESDVQQDDRFSSVAVGKRAQEE